MGVKQCGELFPREYDAKRRGRMVEDIESPHLGDMLSVAERVQEGLGGRSGTEFKRWLRESVGALTVGDGGVIEALRDLEVPLVTTNYDGLLAEVTKRPVVTWRETDEVARVLRGGSDGVLHLHGHWKQPESVVLGIRSYEAVRQDEHAQAVMRALAMTTSLVFVGCGEGLTDPNFQPFLAWLERVNAGNTARHYRLCREEEVEKLQAEHPQGQRVFVLAYGKKHDELAGFLAGLKTGGVAGTGIRADKGVEVRKEKGPRHSEAIAEYLKRLRKATAKLQLMGIGKGIPIEFPIEQAYVPLNVMARMAMGDEVAGWGKKERREGEVYGDGEIELAKVFGYAKKREHSGVILLGDPGAGKTTGARQFCWRVLQVAELGPVAGLPADVIPVFLRLRDLRREHGTLNEFIRAALAAPNAGRAEVENPAGDLLERKGILWVFDGLDEVVDEATRVKVCQWIQKAMEDRAEDFYLVTSRYQGYQGKVSLGPSFCRFQVKPLTPEQVGEFVEHWYGAVFRRLHGDGPEVGEKAAAEVASLRGILAQPDYRIGRLRELPANPLMLTILCVVHHENHNLPRRRADLYARCVRVLVEHWRQEVREAAGLTPFDPEAAESVLGSVAWWMHGEDDRTTETVAALGDAATRALVDIAGGAGVGRAGRQSVGRRRGESGGGGPGGGGGGGRGGAGGGGGGGKGGGGRAGGGTGISSSGGCGMRAGFWRRTGMGRWVFCI